MTLESGQWAEILTKSLVTCQIVLWLFKVSSNYFTFMLSCFNMLTSSSASFTSSVLLSLLITAPHFLTYTKGIQISALIACIPQTFLEFTAKWFINMWLQQSFFLCLDKILLSLYFCTGCLAHFIRACP